MDGTICLCGSSAEMVAGRPLTWAHSCRTGCGCRPQSPQCFPRSRCDPSTLWLRELCSDLSMTVHQKDIDRRKHTWYSIYCSKVRWARCCSENSALILAPHKFIPQNIVRSLTGISTCKTGRTGQKVTALGLLCPFCRLTGKDRPFQAADDVLSAAFCDTHFRGWSRRRTVLCCPLLF